MQLLLYSQYELFIITMEYEQLEKEKKQITFYVKNRRLVEALAALRKLAESTPTWEHMNTIESLEQSYKYLIHYAVEGVADPNRNEIHTGIENQIIKLTDVIINELYSKESPKLYYTTMRIEKRRPDSLASIIEKLKIANNNVDDYNALEAGKKETSQLHDLLLEKEDLEIKFFKRIWVSYPVEKDTVATIASVVNDNNAPIGVRTLAITASMLNLLEHYSENLLMMLFDIYANTENTIDIRLKALTCAIIAALMHKKRLEYSEELKARCEMFADNHEAANDIMNVFIQLIRSRGTEKLMRKVRDELNPKIMNISPELRRKLQSQDFDETEMASNPEWQEILDKSGIAEKMQELNQMQMEGNDVFMSSFSQLKNFPFFYVISNWFLPFDANHSSIHHVMTNNNPIFTMVKKSSMFCDSDKFSFALSVASIPEAQRSMMVGQFDEQQAQIKDLMNSELPDPKKERENITNKFVQNLYRFFNLFNKKSEFVNPFKTTMNLIEIPYIANVLEDSDKLNVIAEFYFKQQFYGDALTLFRRLEKSMQPTSSLFQKMGYCLEMESELEEAIEYYRKAELLNDNDVWTLKHIALSLRYCSKTAEALEYYKRIETLQPNNIATTKNIAGCYLEIGNYTEALKYFYKVDYIVNGGPKTLRPIAWCLFLNKEYEKSENTYRQILTGKANADDYINMGHVLLVQGKIKEAVQSYQLSLSHGNKLVDTLKTINSDNGILTNAGVEMNILYLIFDKLRFDNPQQD